MMIPMNRLIDHAINFGVTVVAAVAITADHLAELWAPVPQGRRLPEPTDNELDRVI